MNAANFAQHKIHKFTKTVIPFALVGYEFDTRDVAMTWLFIISYPTRAYGIIVN